MITITFECCWESSWTSPIDGQGRLTSALFTLARTEGSSRVGCCNKTREMSSVSWSPSRFKFNGFRGLFKIECVKLDMRPRFRLCRIGDFLGSFLVGINWALFGL